MAKKTTILVVDDEEDIRETLKTILEKNGYKVVKAVNGDDCLKKAKAQKFDLILMDIMMPGKPVKEVIPKIKNTRILFVCVVRTSETEKAELLDMPNIVGIIEKPFDIQELLKKIRETTG